MTEGPTLTDPIALLEAVDKTIRTKARRKAYHAYILKLASSDVPVILTPAHLADVLGLDYNVLRSMAFGAHSFYETFFVPKHSGGLRRIDAPMPSLAKVQRLIQEIVLSKLSVSPAASAYSTGKSILDHVTPHAKSRSLLRVDIEHFFPSIDIVRVKGIFESLGYSRRLSNFISHLLTLEGSLPQGAPSSPLISNIILKSFDAKVIDYCNQHGYVYTRYADDIAISGSDFFPHEAHMHAKKLLAAEGFTINEKKTRYFGENHAGWLLTGLSIGRDGKIRLPKAKRRVIRQRVYYLLKFMKHDLANPNKKSKRILHDVLLPDRVLGQLRFWLWVEPNDETAIAMFNQLKECVKSVSDQGWPDDIVSVLLQESAPSKIQLGGFD